MDAAFIHPLADPRGWRYGSGLTTWTERLRSGRLLCAAFTDNGLPVHPAMDEEVDVPAFDLVVDGDSLASGWEESGFRVEGDDGLVRGVLTLRHALRPVELAVVTECSAVGFFRRRLELTNRSTDAVLGVTAITPLCGALWRTTDDLREDLRPPASPFAVGSFDETDYSYEGSFDWHEVPLNGEFAALSLNGKSGHGNPFALVRNTLAGGWAAIALGWSANWRIGFHAEYRKDAFRFTQWMRLRFSAGPVAVPPARLVEPGETVRSPEVHLGLGRGDLDDAVQRWHAYLRRHVLVRGRGRPQPVIYNNCSYMYAEMTEARLRDEIDAAAVIGAELFMVDAGWFGPVGSRWDRHVGDWRAGGRLPNDLFPVFAYARSKGLGCGLWVEIESVGEDSALAREHPDWLVERYGEKVTRCLDFSRPAVARWAEDEMARLIERYQLEMLRLDYNNFNVAEGGFNLRHGRQENTLWRHVEAIWGIFDRLGRRFPDTMFENCAGGGGRTDVGMLARFDTTWVSDWNRLPRTVRILNGMSIALPPEVVCRMYGAAIAASFRGSADTLFHIPLLAHPTVSGIAPSGGEWNPALVALARKYMAIWKDFIRPFQRDCRVFHHVPVVRGPDAEGWWAMELAAPDASRAVAVAVRLLHAQGDMYGLRFRGLAQDQQYELTAEPGGITATVSGWELTERGLEVRLEDPLSSRLYMARRAD